MNDSTVQFIYANGNTVSLFYKIDGVSLTIQGGCIEACGSKFIRLTAQYVNIVLLIIFAFLIFDIVGQ